MADSYLPWTKVAESVAQIGFATSSILGFILILLNIFGVRRMFGTYKHIMNIFTGLGIVFGTIEVVLYPNLHSYNAGYLLFTLSKPFNLQKNVLTMLLTVYTGVYSCTISLLAVQFIYRYWTIFSENNMKYFRGWKSVVWLIYCVSFGSLWAAGSFTFDKMDPISTKYFRKEMLTRYSALIEMTPAMAMVAYDPTNGSIRWWNLMCCVNMSFVMGVQYAVIIYCGVSMYLQMEERLVNMSQAMKQHHKQLFKVLVLQISAPTLILFTPVLFIVYLPFLNLEISMPMGAVLCGFTFYPAMDAVIVMYVVTEYKKAAKKLLQSAVKHLLNMAGSFDENTTTLELRLSQMNF